jgi:diketogulonate reductase-like aldo/keto reductase
MLRLSNGIDMPAVGFGTYQMTPDDCYRSVLAALETGYRLIDTVGDQPSKNGHSLLHRVFGG